MPAIAIGANRKGRASKEAILHVATECFAATGFRGTTMADVAAAAGLTHPGLLYHYPRKEELLIAVMERHLAEGIGRLTAAVPRGSDAVLDAMLEIARDNVADPTWVRLTAALMGEGLDTDHPAHPFLLDRARRIADALADGLRDLEPDARRRARLARMLNGAWDGIRVHGVLDPDGDALEELRELIDLTRARRAAG
jgi:AcrR family transcriptional regulator